ncbi:MAG: SUMF1/EgtB/PvdO family nonheme iron enzyme [Gammaproteobacteria bacterium]|nr:SUMF1/EgtB/PvdO family nonheme iron enzyme [Gammaproteobacteria bacterium]
MPEQKNELEQKLGRARREFRARILFGAGGGAVVLVCAVLFAVFFHSAPYTIEPPEAAQRATVSLGGAGVAFGGRAYWFGARAELRAAAPGFVARAVALEAGDAPVVTLQPAPARVVITTNPPLAETDWRVNGEHAFRGARFEQSLPAGTARIEADHEFHLPQTLELEARRGDVIEREIALAPVGGVINVESEPAGARVSLNGGERGVTPLQIQAPGGAHRLQLFLDGHEDIDEEITITNKSPEVRRSYRMKPQSGEVRVVASPPGGALLVNGARAQGNVLSLPSGRAHLLRYESPGYVAQSREVSPSPDATQNIFFDLKKAFGEVEIRSAPRAEIFVGGKSFGDTPATLRLQAVEQTIILKSAGHRDHELPVTPDPALPKALSAKLVSELDARMAEAPEMLTAAGGVEMKLFDPRSRARFTMGAPESDKQRRANEFRRAVELTKPFYVGIHEVTEEQFSQYKKIPNAGNNLPARNVSWADAVGFANWMSARDKLQPAYELRDGRIAGFNPRADGYRLLSEAEWEWLARVAGRIRTGRFVWGNTETIPKGSGNFADESAKGAVPKYIPRYDDGFAGVAPVGSFAPDPAGLYDVAGNVSEWVHGAHDLRPPAPETQVDPFGPVRGAERVVKGAGFRSASLVELRASYRQGVSRARDDVGFRVARYVYGGAE